MSAEKPKRFSTDEEIKELAHEWKEAAYGAENPKNRHPNEIYGYKAARVEEAEWGEKINELHNISFIREIIPHLLERKRTIKILDIGTGIGLYVDQLRKTFGDKVDVYSTGLSKQAARAFRKWSKYHPKGFRLDSLGHKDLKWRSILELSDYEEFDLIIETFGEAYYGKTAQISRAEYIKKIIKKLTLGGFASIYPYAERRLSEGQRREIEEEFGAKLIELLYSLRILKDPGKDAGLVEIVTPKE